MQDDIIKKLQKWVKDNYNPRECGWTSERSFGNYDDCFEDGTSQGKSWAAYEVGQILEMKLKKPDEPKYD